MFCGCCGTSVTGAMPFYGDIDQVLGKRDVLLDTIFTFEYAPADIACEQALLKSHESI
jgi:hypothetical protein